MRRRESGRVEEGEEDGEAEVGEGEAAVGCDGLPGSLPQRGAGLPFTPEKGPDERAAAPARRHWRSHSRCGATLRVTKRAVTEGGTPRPLPTPPRPSVSHTRLPVPGHKRPVHHPALGAAPPPPHFPLGTSPRARRRRQSRGYGSAAARFFFFFFFGSHGSGNVAGGGGVAPAGGPVRPRRGGPSDRALVDAAAAAARRRSGRGRPVPPQGAGRVRAGDG